MATRCGSFRLGLLKPPFDRAKVSADFFKLAA
jgi:hypothetical protein